MQVTYLCLEQSHDVLELHVGIDLNDKGLAKIGDKRQFHREI